MTQGNENTRKRKMIIQESKEKVEKEDREEERTENGDKGDIEKE